MLATLDSRVAGQNVILVLPGDGTGLLGPARAYDVGTSPVAAVIQDLNGDGRADLAVVNVDSADVSILQGDGTGGFMSERGFAAGSRLVDIEAGDFDEDGRPDLAVGDDVGRSVELLFNRTTPGRSPRAVAGPDVTSECNAPGGSSFMLDGSASSDPDSSPGTDDDIVSFEWLEQFGQPSQALLGTGKELQVALSLGLHLITLRVTDRQGNQDEDEVRVTIVDTSSPSLIVTLAPAILWPPNHRMVDVRAIARANDVCGSVLVTLVDVHSNEPDDASGGGDGNTAEDIEGAEIGTSDLAFALRAERAAGGGGRIYTATYSARDGSGNVSTTSATVAVPDSSNNSAEPLLLEARQTGQGTIVVWDPVPDALSYDIIRGRLESLRETDLIIDLGAVVILDRDLSVGLTTSVPDPEEPERGHAFFYLVEYDDGLRSSFGTVSTAKPRVPGTVTTRSASN